MELQAFLSEVTAIPGTPGREEAVSRYIASKFEEVCDDVRVDVMENVIARVGSQGPRIMIAAHLDEIGLVVSQIEEDGSIRFTRSGGVDPRILPSMEVAVQTQEGALFGVIGAKPPHLLSESDRNKAIKLEDLYIDIGFSAEEVKKKVRVGDMVVMLAPYQELADHCAASKTMDDRASVAAMLECAKRLTRLNTKAQVFFVSTSQEEVGSAGAVTAAYALDPDMAIAIDVTHGAGPGTGKFEAFPLDVVPLTMGPNIHPMLLEKPVQAAQRHKVNYTIEVNGGVTWTDADPIQVARAGVPTVLISIPLRYMHTTVETLSLDTVREAGRLMAEFIADIAEEWGDLKWY